ncbi:prepilin peptidase [Candidatus Sumerlaeota bacterium]|nr:prepilin peptidase [Candidatus Sumerlaeota bacterium]
MVDQETIELGPIVLLLIVPVIIYTEIKDGKIYNWLTLPALALGLFLGLLQGFGPFLISLKYALIAGGCFMIPYLITGWSRGRPSVGGGDVKLAAAIGALDPAHVFSILMWAVMFGGTIGLGFIIWKSYKNRQLRKQQEENEEKPTDGVLGLMTQRIPFGTSMCLGILWVLLR